MNDVGIITDEIPLPKVIFDNYYFLKINEWSVQLVGCTQELKLNKHPYCITIRRMQRDLIEVAIGSNNYSSYFHTFCPNGLYSELPEKYRKIIRNIMDSLLPWIKEKENSEFHDALIEKDYSFIKDEWTKTDANVKIF